MIKYFLVFFMLFLSYNFVYSQNRVISGMVVDDSPELYPIIGVSMIINDSINITETGVDGSFQFETSLPVYKLSFSLVNYERVDLMLLEKCNIVDVVMITDATYDFMSYRKINKERRKKYKELPKLHKKAYEKGVFQSLEPCYTREFVEWTKKRVP